MAGIIADAVLGQYPHIFGHAELPVERVVVHGKVTREDDPKWRDEGNAIFKPVSVENLPLTVIRWLALGRKITGITPYH